MNPDEPTSASADAVDGCPPDISSAFPPPSPIPSLRLTQPLPPPPTGLYFGLACLGSLGAACVLLFTPWLGQSVPKRTRSETSSMRGNDSSSRFGGIPEMSSQTF